jgi:hypothetical protein
VNLNRRLRTPLHAVLFSASALSGCADALRDEVQTSGQGSLSATTVATEVEVASAGAASTLPTTSTSVAQALNSTTSVASALLPASPQPANDAGELELELVSAKIDGKFTLFGRDVFTYGGRVSSVDISGQASEGDASPWQMLRFAVVPSDERLAAGDYICTTPGTWMSLRGHQSFYATYYAGSSCSVHIELAGTKDGDWFTGSFEAVLTSMEGESLQITEGSFRGRVQGFGA